MQATTNVDYGATIREAPMAKGWSRADLAEVYGHFFTMILSAKQPLE